MWVVSLSVGVEEMELASLALPGSKSRPAASSAVVAAVKPETPDSGSEKSACCIISFDVADVSLCGCWGEGAGGSLLTWKQVALSGLVVWRRCRESGGPDSGSERPACCIISSYADDVSSCWCRVDGADGSHLT
ncbi:uncharacterized protein BDZ99DRAFT_75916 [Mytilinidion resinicola]|uniref:Uncharacterized protein n=1 Tax=Mytilinidion resinicola TaxID=574789 RepID=A0A6A6YF44_9PEZI|nr:uncharacterized protein BDZ99DRAFT_75916 [Mytilinidion resinicola]KAF2807198.1 hypothetical protein BDZ99DRAFT_75916 [Mytilinidion resinicola]